MAQPMTMITGKPLTVLGIMLAALLASSCGVDSETKKRLEKVDKKYERAMQVIESLQKNVDELHEGVEQLKDKEDKQQQRVSSVPARTKMYRVWQVRSLKDAGLEESLAEKVARIKSERYRVLSEERKQKHITDIKGFYNKFREDTEAEIRKTLGAENFTKYMAAKKERSKKRNERLAKAVKVDVETAKKIAEVERNFHAKVYEVYENRKKSPGADEETSYHEILKLHRPEADAEIKGLLGYDEKKFSLYNDYRQEKIKEWRKNKIKLTGKKEGEPQ